MFEVEAGEVVSGWTYYYIDAAVDSKGERGA